MHAAVSVDRHIVYVDFGTVGSYPLPRLQGYEYNWALSGTKTGSALSGGIGGVAPDRQTDLARLGLRAMLGGTLACFMTAGVLL